MDNRGGNDGTWLRNWSMSLAYAHAQSFSWEDSIPMHHGNLPTSFFVDGHAESHQWINATLVAYGKSIATGGRGFNPPPVACRPDYECVYQNYRFPAWAN